MTEVASPGASSATPVTIDERTAFARLIKRWSEADKLQPTNEDLLAQLCVLTEAGRLQLEFWGEEFSETLEKKLTPAGRVSLRNRICKSQFEQLCSDGRARYEYVRSMLEGGDGPSAKILEKLNALTAEADEMRKLLEAHAIELRTVLPGTEAAELLNQVKQLSDGLGGLAARLSRDHGWRWFGWGVPDPVRWVLQFLGWWAKTAVEIFMGIFGLVLVFQILAAVPLIGPPFRASLRIIGHEFAAYTTEPASSAPPSDNPEAPAPSNGPATTPLSNKSAG